MYTIKLFVKTLILINFGFIYCIIRHNLTVVTENYITSLHFSVFFTGLFINVYWDKFGTSWDKHYLVLLSKYCSISYCDKTDYSPGYEWRKPYLDYKDIPLSKRMELPVPIPEKLSCGNLDKIDASDYDGNVPLMKLGAIFHKYYKKSYRQITLQVRSHLHQYSFWGLIGTQFKFNTITPSHENINIFHFGLNRSYSLVYFYEQVECTPDYYGQNCEFLCEPDERKLCIPPHEKDGFIITEECKKGYVEGYFIQRRLIKCGYQLVYLNNSLQKCMYKDSCISGMVNCPGNQKCFFVENFTTFCYNESVYIKNDYTNFTIPSAQQIVFDKMIVHVKISPPLIPEYAVELFKYYFNYNYETSTKCKTLKDRIERNKNIRINTPTSIQFIKNSINFTYGDDYLIDLIVIYRYGYYKFTYKFNFTFSDQPSSITFPDKFYFGAMTIFYFETNLETNQSIQSFIKLNNVVVSSDITRSQFLIPVTFIKESVLTISSKLTVTNLVSITHSGSKLIRIIPYINFTWIDQNKGRRSENESIECHVSTSINFTIHLFQLTGPTNIDINDTIKVILKNILPGKYKFICVVYFPTINVSYSRFLNFYFIQKPTQLCLKSFPGFKGYITKCSSDGFPSNQGRFIIQLIQKNYSIQLFRLRSRYLQIPFKIYEHLIYTIRCVNVFYYGDNAYESELIKEISFPLSPKLQDYQVENHPCQNDTSFEAYGSGQHEHEKFDYFRFYVTCNEVKIEIGSTYQILFFIFGSLSVLFAYLGHRYNESETLYQNTYRLMQQNLRRIIRNVNEKAVYQMRCKFLYILNPVNSHFESDHRISTTYILSNYDILYLRLCNLEKFHSLL